MLGHCSELSPHKGNLLFHPSSRVNSTKRLHIHQDDSASNPLEGDINGQAPTVDTTCNTEHNNDGELELSAAVREDPVDMLASKFQEPQGQVDDTLEQNQSLPWPDRFNKPIVHLGAQFPTYNSPDTHIARADHPRISIHSTAAFDADLANAYFEENALISSSFEKANSPNTFEWYDSTQSQGLDSVSVQGIQEYTTPFSVVSNEDQNFRVMSVICTHDSQAPDIVINDHHGGLVTPSESACNGQLPREEMGLPSPLSSQQRPVYRSLAQAQTVGGVLFDLHIGSSKETPRTSMSYSDTRSTTARPPYLLPHSFEINSPFDHNSRNVQYDFLDTLTDNKSRIDPADHPALSPASSDLTSDCCPSSSQSTGDSSLHADESTTACPHCPEAVYSGSRADRKRNLRRHNEDKHVDISRLSCPERNPTCPVTFPAGRKDNLKRHLTKQHGWVFLPSPPRSRKRKADEMTESLFL